jgi:hypothetical protein
MDSILLQILHKYGQQNLRRKLPSLGSYQKAHAHATQDAVDLLNTLQTPYEVLKQRWDAGIRIDKTANEEMRKCLAQIGYSVTLLVLLALDIADVI